MTNIYLNPDHFFAPNACSIAVNNVNNAIGFYEPAPSVKGNHTGFSGTKTIFT